MRPSALYWFRSLILQQLIRSFFGYWSDYRYVTAAACPLYWYLLVLVHKYSALKSRGYWCVLGTCRCKLESWHEENSIRMESHDAQSWYLLLLLKLRCWYADKVRSSAWQDKLCCWLKIWNCPLSVCLMGLTLKLLLRCSPFSAVAFLLVVGSLFQKKQTPLLACFLSLRKFESNLHLQW